MGRNLLCGVIAAGVCFFLSPIVRRAALRLGTFDEPGGRRIHMNRIPRLGGLAILLAYTGALGVGLWITPILREALFQQNHEKTWLLIGVGVIVAVGVADDLWDLSPWTKLAAESTAALLAFMSGFHLTALEHPFTGAQVLLGPLSLPVTVGWMLCLMNAFNVIDGLDGLATGVALITTITIWIITLTGGREDLALLAATLSGALLGFLFHNFHPASIFLGDSGSLFIGYVLSILAVQASRTDTIEVRPLIPLMLFALPLLDLVFAAVRRFCASLRQPFHTRDLPRLCLLGLQAMLQPDRHHIHHRLLTHGFSHRQAVFVLYLISVGCSGASVFLFFFL